MCTTTPHRLARARRRESIDAERLLWFHLRDGRLAGLEVHRGHPIGPFVAPFLVFDPRLVVETVERLQAARADDARVRFMARRGFSLLSVSQHDVLVRTDQVLERILEAALPAGSARRAIAR